LLHLVLKINTIWSKNMRILTVRRNSMRHFILISLLVFLVLLEVSGQNRLNYLKTQLLSADSVIIVSHEATAGIGLVDEKTGKHLPPPKLIVNGRLNETILHEKWVLKNTSIQRLSSIITRPFQDSVIERGMCFIPHHAVVIFKKRKTSFVDICFGCRGIETSRDIKMTAWDIDFRKWEELRDFFKQHGMKFELEFEEDSKDE